MKRRVLLAFLLPLLAVTACSDRQEVFAPDDARFGVTAADPITVMSRNLYLGADIDALINPAIPLEQSLPVALYQLQRTNFPARAQYLAMEIAARQPQVIGLQEVTRYDFLTAGGPQTIDFLAILQLYLAGMGMAYDVAVYQPNVSITLPGIAPIIALTYTDGDAILVRSDIDWKDADAGHYDSQVSLSVMGNIFENLRGWNAVSVALNDRWYRFFNTHLEIQAFRPYQEGQARELAAMAATETLPTIMVGDFNSAANNDAPAASRTASYDILRRAGFIDLWVRQPHSFGGLTCCHAADLSNATSQPPEFDQRIDIVFVRNGKNGFGGQAQVEVFGEAPGDRFMVGPNYYLWPSDHAGVFASLWFAPGQLKK